MEKMKKYRISLALKIPSNFNIEVDAMNKNAAVEEAIEKYQRGEFDEDNIDDIDWTNSELDINEQDDINSIKNGICIEEI